MDDVQFSTGYKTDAKPKPQSPPDETSRRVNETLGNSQEILATTNTVFPLTLFPDTVTIDREKLTITHRFFFSVGELTTIRIEDILDVTADVGPWFGALKISTNFFTKDRPQAINYLRRADALRFKRILEGYMIAIQKKIDTSQFTAPQLTMLLEGLGQGGPSEDV